MREFDSLKICDILDLCDVISRIRPNDPMTLLPVDDREAVRAQLWRAALAEHQDLFDELAGILNR
jgi:hypothetical protein